MDADRKNTTPCLAYIAPNSKPALPANANPPPPAKQAAKADAKFLCGVNVMDYSMLFCVHDSTKPADAPAERRDSMEQRYSSL